MESISGCNKIDLDVSKYSSPVPMIGMYIAVVSLVCFLLMVYDVAYAFRTKKVWIPCRAFSLNSAIFLVLGVATKLPVDLTTPMPGPQDQLSKLTGSVLICSSMAFFLPSLGVKGKTECLTNMIALSIFVVTVVANIIIQFNNGVVFNFIPEHIIVMCLMLFLLIVSWFSALSINYHKDIILNINKKLFKECHGSMFNRLKLAYMLGYNNDPQFLLSKFCVRRFTSFCSSVCFVLIFQAAFKSTFSGDCQQFSDYGWSVIMVLVTQILTISLAFFAVTYKKFSLHLSEESFGTHDPKYVNINYVVYRNPILKNTLRESFYTIAYFVMVSILILAGFVLILVEKGQKYLLKKILNSSKPKHINNTDIQEYKHLVNQVVNCNDEWALDQSVIDMKRRMEVNRRTNQPLSHLSQLLLKTLPSTRPMQNKKINDQLYPDQPGIPVNSLSLVLLVRIAQVSLPSELGKALVDAYNDSHKIIHFIDTRTKFETFEDQTISLLAKAVWRGSELNLLLPLPTDDQNHSDIDEAIKIIKFLSGVRPADIVWEAIGSISAFISRHKYSSVSDLYIYMEQLIVDMVHILFAQLPQVIIKDVAESAVEDIAQRAMHGLQILEQITPLEDHIQWSFPVDSNISSLITSQIEIGGPLDV